MEALRSSTALRAGGALFLLGAVLVVGACGQTEQQNSSLLEERKAVPVGLDTPAPLNKDPNRAPPTALNVAASLPENRNAILPQPLDRVATLPAGARRVTPADAYKPVAEQAQQRQAPPKPTVAHRRQGFADALEVAQRDGFVTVTVMLSTAEADDRDLREQGAAENEASRAALRKLQNDFVNKLAGSFPGGRVASNRERVSLFNAFPFVTLEVNLQELSAIEAMPEVEAVSVRRALKPNTTSSVPLVGAPQAWSRGARGQGQTIAIIDTGVQHDHPFLSGRVHGGACFSQLSGNLYIDGVVRAQLLSACPNNQASMVGPGAGTYCAASPWLNDGARVECTHGTRMSGVAAGRAVSGSPGSGVAPDATIYPVQVASMKREPMYITNPPTWSGWYPVLYNDDITKALSHVWEVRGQYNFAAVNMSLGIGAYTGNCDGVDALMTSAFFRLKQAGIPVVVATGNDAYRGWINFPSCSSHVIPVGRTTKDDVIATNGNLNASVQLVATGGGAPASNPLDLNIRSSAPPSAYSLNSGTSEAAAHVSGAMAILKGYGRPANVDLLFQELLVNGKPISDGSQIYRRLALDNVFKRQAAVVSTVVGSYLSDGN